MPIINFTKEDFDKSKPLPVGWYKAALQLFKTETNKKKDGLNQYFEFVVQSHDGRVVKAWISDKSFNYAEQLGKAYAALAQVAYDPNGMAIDTDWLAEENTRGTALWIHLNVNTGANGIPGNTVDGFLSAEVEDPSSIPF